MERLTKDSPKENFETMMNYVFVKDGWAHIRHDGESENVPLTTWAKAQCIKRGCDDFPGETAKEIDETLCDCLMDGEGCPMALAYCFACQASHLRDRLKSIEDILGDVYDLDHLRKIKSKTIAEEKRRTRLADMRAGKTLDGVPVGVALPKLDMESEATQTDAGMAAIKDIPLQRLMELAQAERDERLVVLPCKVGDTVYRVFTPKGREPVIVPCEIKTVGQAADLAGKIGKKCWLVSTYLTREEAEEALRKEEKHEAY